MPRIAHLILCCVLMIVITWLAAGTTQAMPEVPFKIDRMVTSAAVTDREPVGVAETFPASMEKVYCFLAAHEIEEDTEVTFVWYNEKKEMARITLPLRTGNRWRTFASKRINGLKGQWSVDLLDGMGIVRNSISFTVE